MILAIGDGWIDGLNANILEEGLPELNNKLGDWDWPIYTAVCEAGSEREPAVCSPGGWGAGGKGDPEGWDTREHMAESFHCTADTNTAL